MKNSTQAPSPPRHRLGQLRYRHGNPLLETAPLFRAAFLAALSLCTQAFAAVNIEFVVVGNPDNPNDPLNKDPYGRVNYAFSIAKNETTIGDYAQFLNAVAKTDTYQLYSTNMTAPANNGISRSGSSGSYIYQVNPGSENKPVTWVSWFDAARFTNWLHNGQTTGPQDSATTEDGAYTLSGAMSGVVVRNVGATVWIPSENEWYKAAYYDPNKNGTGAGGYWLQATQSDTLAGNSIGVADSANYFDGDFYGYPASAYSDVGAYGSNSESAYGTNDQAGNVYEWNDAVVTATKRGLRGGNFSSGYFGSDVDLDASFRGSYDSSSADFGIGFRVATIPEPTSAVLGIMTGGLLMFRRRLQS